MKGTFVSLEFSFGPVLNERITGAHAYSNKTWTCGDKVPRKVENTCVPVFLRLRSDVKNMEVTPYFQIDMGYSFMDMYSRDDMVRIKHAPLDMEPLTLIQTKMSYGVIS